jgi:DNA invertase Pin-like site-specific DNA recombinase
MPTAKPAALRCAIYTRKSSEEGLEQDFNSLHAQREACEAFVKSQRGEGWQAIATAYDDGGISGGTMERPGLRRLLADVDAGKIDVIVVYKVDRLTRSLMDFSKIVERLDAKSVSFVAVTQQFNTTSSMGRLTLNILLSFAQFEREVTGERIRDKIAASKRKGMWMGGRVPLGYDVRDRKLEVNEAEAATVREIFQLYLELGCVRKLKQELDLRDIKSKRRVSGTGKTLGGISIGRGALYEMLCNPIYIGLTRHKDVTYPGQHDAILDAALWDSVQAQLKASNASPADGPRPTQVDPSPLLGKLVDDQGERLVPHHANKQGRRYRYYVSAALLTGEGRPEGAGWRIPAAELERTIRRLINLTLRDQTAIVRAAQAAGIADNYLPTLIDRARRLSASLDDEIEFPKRLVDRIALQPDGIKLTISVAEGLPMDVEPLLVTCHHPIQMKQRGHEMRLIIDGDNANQAADPVLVKAVARGHSWFDELVSGRVSSLEELAARDGLKPRYVSRLMRLALLSPEIVEAVVTGRQPTELTAEVLTYPADMPFEWSAQKAHLGFA